VARASDHRLLSASCPCQHLLRQPLVRTEKPQEAGLHPTGSGGPLRPAVDLLADVGAVVGVLRPDRLPASEVSRRLLVDQSLGVVGEAEEPAHHVEDIGVQVVVDAMIDDEEEPDLVAGRAQLVGERFGRRAPVGERRHIDHRNALERHRGHKTILGSTTGCATERDRQDRPPGPRNLRALY